jgi:hypothetical protein
MSQVLSCKGFKMPTSLTSFLLSAFFLGCASAPTATETLAAGGVAPGAI